VDRVWTSRAAGDPSASPAEHCPWVLRGASLAVWGGELVCVAGADAVALHALADCTGADAAAMAGTVRRRTPSVRWIGASDPRRPASRDTARRRSIVAEAVGAAARTPTLYVALGANVPADLLGLTGLVTARSAVLALQVVTHPAGWVRLVGQTEAVAAVVPVRLLVLRDGRIAQPGGSVRFR
jgi:hypothetical protein